MIIDQDNTKEQLVNELAGLRYRVIELETLENERKQAEDREKKLQEELTLSSRLAFIGELAAGVVHRLNNPLRVVLGFSERLLRKSTDENTKNDLERIHNEALRAAAVIENLLTFTRRREPRKEDLRYKCYYTESG